MKIPCNSYIEYKDCDCGGIFAEKVGIVMYLSDPIRCDYKCNRCGKILALMESEMPKVIYEIVKESEGN